jgi:hypothetical protein
MRDAGETWAAIGKTLGCTGDTVRLRLDPVWAVERREQVNRCRWARGGDKAYRRPPEASFPTTGLNLPSVPRTVPRHGYCSTEGADCVQVSVPLIASLQLIQERPLT